MVDIAAISGLTSSLKATSDIAKAMLGIRDELLIREKAVELNAQVMTAQSSALAAQAAQAELVERVRQLEQKVVELEDWEREKCRYQLAEIATGVFAYATKPGMEDGEPPHRICARCYQDGRKSILQGISRTKNWTKLDLLVCHVCDAEIVLASHTISISSAAVQASGRSRTLW
ncbi:hypothetical protein [Methylobacterium sp. J-068]|uniref:hypothetical protein n=1 Tax=Methylobacterium sp. J-068 TaxID=2836649 RepID=UPI001FB8EF55|nr:hypothetical protein [Methylobacterium sp. J-068]MCJ2033046.1 hypothetical protein [Methylobacterium sp. J-068]